MTNVFPCTFHFIDRPQFKVPLQINSVLTGLISATRVCKSSTAGIEFHCTSTTTTTHQYPNAKYNGDKISTDWNIFCKFSVKVNKLRMEALPEHPEEDATTRENDQETAFTASNNPEQEPLKGTTTGHGGRKISSTSTTRASSSSSAPGSGRRPSRRGSIFVAEEPYSDCLSGYVPDEPEPEDDVFRVK